MATGKRKRKRPKKDPAAAHEDPEVGEAVGAPVEEAAEPAPASADKAGEPAPKGDDPLAGVRGLAEQPFFTKGALLVLAALAALIYVNSIWVPFLFDDAPVVTRNRLLWSADGLWPLIKQQPDRALTNLTFFVNFQLAHLGTVPLHPFGLRDWWSYHVVSIVLHAVNAGLVFLLVRALLQALGGEVPRRAIPWVALGGAALWAAHPAHGMAVAYIAQRYALLATTAFLGTLLLYLELRRRAERSVASGGDWGSAVADHPLLLLGALAAAAACGVTKPNAVVVPFAVLALEVVVFRGRMRGLALLFFAPFALGGLLAVGMYGFEGVLARFFPAECPTSDRLEYLITQIAVVPRYLHLFALPHDLCVEQSFPVLYDSARGAFTSADAPLRLAVAAAAHALLWALAGLLYWRGLRLVPLAIGWFYLTLVVESSVIPILDPMVDHRMYLPTVLLAPALLGSLARAWPALVKRAEWVRTAAPVAIAALVLVLGVATFARNFVWASPTGIWEDTIAKRPHCARAYSSLGMEHLYQGEWLEAVGPIETALILGPYHVEGWNNLGKAYLELEMWDQAERALLRGIEVHEVVPSPSIPLCWNNLGLVYIKKALEAPNPAARRQLFAKALQRLEGAVRLDPRYEVAYLNLATAAYELMLSSGQADRPRYAQIVVQAVDGAEQVARMRGGALGFDAARRRIQAQARIGQAGQAFTQLEALLQNDLMPHVRLALLTDLADAALLAHEGGDLVRRAAAQLDAVLGGPQAFPELLLARGRLAEALGQGDDAVRFFQLGLEAAPEHSDAELYRERIRDLQQRTTVPGPD